MFNIHLMGNFKDISQLTNGRPLPENAVQFKEGEDFTDIFMTGLKIAIPIGMIMVIGAIIRIFNLDNTVKFTITTLVLLICAAASTFLLAYVHEFIHGIFYPIKAEKQIWKMLDQGAFFVYCEAKTSKIRFIVMCLAPAIILGIIPYVLWLVFPLALTFNGGLMVLVISLLMTIMAMGDYVNVVNAIRQVPKDAQIFNFGIHSYWIENKNEES